MTGTLDASIRVVSWNIMFGLEVGTAMREIRANEELAAADILLLQEMDEGGTAAIAAALGAAYAYRCVGPHRWTRRQFGNAIISRWPISDVTYLPLPGTATVAGQPRSATRGRVTVRGTEVLAYSVHTETPLMRLGRRVGQFAHIARDVAGSASANAVVGGDFNTLTPRGLRALGGALSNGGLRRVSAAAGPTFRYAGKDRELDHIFARGLEVRASGVVRRTTASDHLPLWVELASAPTA